MIRTVLIVFLLLTCSCKSTETPNATSKQLTVIDSLLDQSIASTIHWRDREEMIKRLRVMDTVVQKEAFRKLAEVSFEDRVDAIGALFALRDTTAFTLLSTYRDSMVEHSYNLLAQYLRRNEWRNRQVNDSLFAYLKQSDKKVVREEILLHFKYQAIYDDLDRIWELRNTCKEPMELYYIYETQVQYKSKKTFNRIVEVFNTPFESKNGTMGMLSSLVVMNRYDLLDELYKFKVRLQKVTNSLEKEVAAEMISSIDYIIPKLEKAKREGRKTYKSLDWGLDFPTKESEEEERKKKQAQEEAAAKEKKSPATEINLDWGLDK